MDVPINYRIASGQDADLDAIAHHFYRMWLDNGILTTGIKTDWQEITQNFIDRAIAELAYRAFIAEINEEIIGSVSCQLYSGLYPQILAENNRKYGYIWGVYVEPEYRRRGIGKDLTQRAITYLKSLNCTRVLLHAAPPGKPLYEELGFTMSNGMWLDL
jgi:GNAT superfamily N-acetyltransferase